MGMIRNESAQFMLLAGFIIAIGLVITTVMLNNIIFESNLAGETGGDTIKYDIVNMMRINGDEMKSAYRNATNASGVSNNNMIANFTNQTKDFGANLSMIYALHGEGVNVSWNVSNWKNGYYANFTDNGTANGATNWTVIENVKNSTIIVNVSSINPAYNFTVNISNATKYWNINFTTKGIQTINNAQIQQNITSAYSISFMNGNTNSGNYTITGNTTYGRNFTRARDYILYSTVTLSASNTRANITIPVSVPW